tara:strand:+ start:193 stop:459 length:267 start_codon:yes stop_codon:yes gene_type:complete
VFGISSRYGDYNALKTGDIKTATKLLTEMNKAIKTLPKAEVNEDLGNFIDNFVTKLTNKSNKTKKSITELKRVRQDIEELKKAVPSDQ